MSFRINLWEAGPERKTPPAGVGSGRKDRFQPPRRNASTRMGSTTFERTPAEAPRRRAALSLGQVIKVTRPVMNLAWGSRRRRPGSIHEVKEFCSHIDLSRVSRSQ